MVVGMISGWFRDLQINSLTTSYIQWSQTSLATFLKGEKLMALALALALYCVSWWSSFDNTSWIYETHYILGVLLFTSHRIDVVQVQDFVCKRRWANRINNGIVSVFFCGILSMCPSAHTKTQYRSSERSRFLCPSFFNYSSYFFNFRVKLIGTHPPP